MIRKRFKNFLALSLAGIMLFGSVPVSAATVQEEVMPIADESAVEELAVSFDSGYAEVGKALSVTVTGATEVTYNWYVDGTWVGDGSSYIPTENDLEAWIEVVVSDGTNETSTKLYCSKLPVVYIDTNGQEITSKENYIDATIKIQGNAQYSSSKVLYEGNTEIRGRGNSTWGLPKKPYRLKLAKKADVFGMGKSKHWVLLANYLDESLMRNTLAYDLSGEMGMEHLSTVWVDVVMNGEYVGNYQFCENVRVDDNRIDIFDWESFAEDAAAVIAEEAGLDEDELVTSMAEEDMSWITSGSVNFNGQTYPLSDYDDGLRTKLEEDYGQSLDSIAELSSLITGGYILELDEYYDEVSKFKTESGQPMMFKNPEFVYTNEDMMEYVQNYVQAFENAVQSDDYTAEYEGADVHYTELYDFEELIDYWLVTEIFFNEEINKKSTYMYKDIDGLMKMGPIWDMDWSAGAPGTNTGSMNQWATNYFNLNAQQYQWYKYLVQDPYFLMKAQERYWEIRNVQVKDMLDSIDVHYEYLEESGEADGERWTGRRSFAEDAESLQYWLNTHIAWMDEQMATEDSLVAGFFTASDSLSLTPAAQDGSALGIDGEEYAPADVVAGTTTDLVLNISSTGKVSGTAEIFINGKVAGNVSLDTSGAAFNITSTALSAAADTKNVIEVKVKDSTDTVIAENYITVKQSDCVHSYGETWNSNEDYHWKECSNGCEKTSGTAKHTFEWVIDTAATETANGVKHEECTVCGYKRSEGTEFEYVEEPMDPSDSSRDIPVSNMVAISDSQNATTGDEGPDDNILDGNVNTIWHTKYGDVAEGALLENRWVGVSFNELTEISGIRYLSRTDGTNGTVIEYKVQYRTTDDGEWIDVAEGSWDDYAENEWKLITFDSVMAKQVRIVGVRTSYSDTTTYPDGKHMSMAEFRVIGNGEVQDSTNESDVIPVTEMTATAGDEQPGEEAKYAIDEDEGTMWHTDWYAGSSHDDHWLQLELKDVYKVDGFHYLPRQSNSNGIITAYEIYVSLDGESWTKVAYGNWEADSSWKYVSFNAVEAKYVKLVTIEAESNQDIKFASAAEVRLTGTKVGGSETPGEEISVSFNSNYAEVGEALSVTVEGTSKEITYSWKVDGQVVSQSVSYTPTEADLESWIEVVVSTDTDTASVKTYFSKLPVVYIDTEGGQAITSKETYINATIKLQGNAEYSSDSVLYEGATQIRGRGNSTWGQPKKPYRLKLDKKANAFGMGKSKHWVLLANYLDESLLRNTLAYDLSGSMGMEQMSTVWVDVVMNGEYVGNYQFCENVRVDEGRVDIFDWEGFAEDAAAVIAEEAGFDEDDLVTSMAEDDMSWITTGYVNYNGTKYNLSAYETGLLEVCEDYGQSLDSIADLPSLITGGYILELDEYYDEVSKFKTDSNQPMMFKNPEFVNTNDDMMDYVQNYVQAFEDAVQSDDYTVTYEGADVHYSDLYDFDSLVDYWLISEIFFNEEFNKKSTYMYKDVDDLMKMGPIWDMDWSSGGEGDTNHTDKWATLHFSLNAQANQWYKDLVQDPYFLMRVQERYWEIRDEQVQNMLDVIDEYHVYLAESGVADGVRWGKGESSFEKDITGLQTWLNTHITWMDTQMATEDSFDAAFLNKDVSLELVVTDAEENALESDTAELAPADGIVQDGAQLRMMISGASGTAEVFVNGRSYNTLAVNEDGTEEYIDAEALTADSGVKNVIEVKIYNDNGTIIAENYVTVKTYVVEKENEIVRLAGKDRYKTSFEVADEYQKVLDVEEFDTVIVATGQKAADALSGSYLAAQKKAPILLTEPGKEASLIEYVKENLTAGGKVYLLGGTGVVSEELETDLGALGYSVKRLKGSDRYGTNLAILEEAGITGNEILVATGEKEFDSLSASATNKPILLVNTEITAAHEEVLEGLPEGSKIWILGGTGAVSEDIEAELKEYSNDVERVKGADRYATSVEIAKTFFGEDAEKVTMAYGEKFPDGLCGGPLAAEIGAPVLLVKENGTDKAAAYAANATSGYVFGGTGVVSDETVKAVLGEDITIIDVVNETENIQ